MAPGVVAALATGSLVACTPGPPGPQEAAAAFASALTSGEFSHVTLVGGTAEDATAQRAAAFAGLGPWQPTVQAGTVTTDEKDPDKASAELTYTWDVDAGDLDWTYTTTARLTRVDTTWTVAWSTFVLAPDLVPGETLTVDRVRAERANVLGAGGAVLVEQRDVSRIGIDKTRVTADDQAAAATALAQALDLDPVQYVGRVAAAGEKAFVEAIVVRVDDLTYDLAALRAMPGVNIVADRLPLAPSRRFARPVLGSVGPATEEIIAESGGAIATGDLAGLSGLQRQYDAQLRGRPGLTIRAVSADGAAVRELFALDPAPSEPLVLTLEPGLQVAAEDVLEEVGPASAIVAIRPSTGDVLAVASGPGGPGLSTARVGAYPPGSTFKVVSALGLLRAGLTPASELECPATVSVDGRSFANYPGYPAGQLGPIPLRSALVHSCNTAFIGARDRVPQRDLAAAAASLGLGGSADLGFPAFMGAVPSSAEGTEHAASMIGQGRVEASPLAMATVAASIAQGARVVPRLVVPGAAGLVPTQEAAPTPGASVTREDTVPEPAPLTQSQAQALREMMRGFVTEGSGEFLLGLPGGDVLAKSGTAQFGAVGALRNHAWMIAIQGDLAVAVFVEDGDYGSTTAGPLLAAFLRAAHS